MIDWFKQLNPYKVAGFGATGAGLSGGALWLMSSTGKDAKEDVENKRKDLLRAAIILKQIPPDQWFGQNADFYTAIKTIGEIHSLTQRPYKYHSEIYDAIYTPTGRLSNIVNPSVLFEIAKVNTAGPIGYDTLGNPQYDPNIVEGFKTEFNKSTGGNLEKAFPMDLQIMQSELSGVPAAIPGAPGTPGAPAAPSATKPVPSIDEYKKRRDEVLGELKSVEYSDGAIRAFYEKFNGILTELENAQSLIKQRQQLLDDVEKRRKSAIDAEIKAQESKIKEGTITRDDVATQAAIRYDNQYATEAIRFRDALISANSKFADVEKQFSDQLAATWNAASKETIYDYIERTDNGVIYVLKKHKNTGQITPVIQGGKTDAETAKAQEVAAKAQSDPASNRPAGTSTAASASAGGAGGAGGDVGPTADGGFRFAPSGGGGGAAREYTPVIHERLELGEDGKVYKIIFDAKRPIGPGNELGRYLAGAEESNQFLGTGLWQLDKNADGSIVAISKDGKMQTIREATPEGLAAVARAQEKSDLELRQARLNDAIAGPELFAKIGKAQYDAESNARKLALEEADIQIKGQAQKISELVAAGKMNVPQALRYLGKFQEAAIEVERARQNFEAERSRRMEEKARAQVFADQYETEDQITSVLNAAGGQAGQAQNVARQAALAKYAGATPGQKLANMRGFDVSYQDPGLYKNTEEYKSMMAPINQEEYGLTPFQKIIEDAVAKTPINAYSPASYFKGIEGILSQLQTSPVSSTGGLERVLSPLPTSPATEAVPSAFPMNTNVTNYSNALIKSPLQTANLFDSLFQDYPGSQFYNTSSAPLSQYPAILESMDTQNTYG